MNRNMLNIVQDLTCLNRVFCSSDYDYAIEYLRKILPFEVISFTQEGEINGWLIPPKWDVLEATIYYNNKVIYDASDNPLKIICLSKPFEGEVSLEELKAHLHYDHRYDDAIPYHFRQMYRSWQRDWGFCVTKRFFDGLKQGRYRVSIKTRESKGTLKLLDYTIKGKLPHTIVFVAHLDHPGMANDDLAGCAVGVELFKRLKDGRDLKFTYKLLLLQEIIGSEYYLHNHKSKELFLESIFIEMLGTNTQLALQNSLNENSSLEIAVKRSMEAKGLSFRTGKFKSIICNDEYIWEAYGIPMSSLSRYPYPEYHTNRDNASIISADALEESVQILVTAVDYLEDTKLVEKRFTGNICLSNPRYDLYIDPGQPAFGTVSSDEVKKMRLLMDLIPSLPKYTTIHNICTTVGLEEKIVESYLRRWEHKGLLSLK